jgi:ABC-type amino acid transport substrate-binding protein
VTKKKEILTTEFTKTAEEKMKKIFWILFLVCIGFPAFAAEEARESVFDRVMRTGTLRCGFIPWPPGFDVDPNTGEVKGPTKELFESIIKLAGWKVEFVQSSLGNVPLELETGKFDAMCADGPWTITNVRLVDYTTPAIYSPIFVYVRESETRFKNYADMNVDGVSFVGIDGDISSDLAGLRFPKAKLRTLINMTDPAQMMMEVADGKADAVILDPVTAENYMKSNPGKMRQLADKNPLAVYPAMMSVKRGEDKLQQTLSRATEMAINIGLVDMKADLYDPTRRTIYVPAKGYMPGK